MDTQGWTGALKLSPGAKHYHETVNERTRR